MNDQLIVICVPTYKRCTLLGECLTAIGKLVKPDAYQIQLLIVDNDKDASASALCADMTELLAFPLQYFVQPEQGLCSVRNRLLEEAIRLGADIIAFIDDDERPDKDWLVNHIKGMNKYGADVCSGPVRPTGSAFIVSDKKVKPTGSRPRYISTNNVVFKTKLIMSQGLRFDPFYNFIGGEDFDFFEQSKKHNNVHIWVDEALVLETIPVQRNSLRYLFYRHFTGGINSVLRYKRSNPAWRAWLRFLPKIIGKLIGAACYCLLSCVRANKRIFATAVKKFANALGYFAGLVNFVVERYRDAGAKDIGHAQ